MFFVFNLNIYFYIKSYFFIFDLFNFCKFDIVICGGWFIKLCILSMMVFIVNKLFNYLLFVLVFKFCMKFGCYIMVFIN